MIGAQVGARVGLKMKGEQLRALLAVMVLGVCIKMGFGLVIEPEELYSVAEAAEQGGH